MGGGGGAIKKKMLAVMLTLTSFVIYLFYTLFVFVVKFFQHICLLIAYKSTRQNACLMLCSTSLQTIS